MAAYNLKQLKTWATQSGIPFWGTPQAKNTTEYDGRDVCKRCNTCEICPTGARYSPDFTFRTLLASKTISLHDQTLVISRQFFRCAADKPYARHDLRVWESSAGREPRLRDEGGRLLLGDALLGDWRARTARGAARVRAYYDVHPSRDSALTLDPSSKNRWGDPFPAIEHRLGEATLAREAATKEHILGLFRLLARANTGKILSTSFSQYLDHPGGG